MLIKQSYKMTSRRMSTRLEETVKNMGSTVQTVRRPLDGGDVTQCRDVALKKRQRLEKKRRISGARRGVLVSGRVVGGY